jgi:hypothetical protein
LHTYDKTYDKTYDNTYDNTYDKTHLPEPCRATTTLCDPLSGEETAPRGVGDNLALPGAYFLFNSTRGLVGFGGPAGWNFSDCALDLFRNRAAIH